MGTTTTLPDLTNTSLNEKSTQYKKASMVTTRTRQHSVHDFSSLLVTGVVTIYSSPSRIQIRSGPTINCDRPPNGRNRLKTGCRYDSIQEMIDSIVASSMSCNQNRGLSQGGPTYDVTSKVPWSRLFENTMKRVTSQVRLADDHTRSSSSSASGTIDIAFNEDTRWRGVHPFNVKVKNIARFEALIPHGYRYARDLQTEAAFIPPPHHPRGSPGKDFVLQKRGTSAIPIVDPKTVTKTQSTCTKTTTTALAFHTEVKYGQIHTPAAPNSISVRLIDQMATQIDLPPPLSDPPIMLKDTITITELEVSAPKTDDVSGSMLRSAPGQSIGQYSTYSVHDHIGVNSVSGHVAHTHSLLVNGVRRKPRRRQV